MTDLRTDAHDLDGPEDAAAVLFANDDWHLLGDGLEHRATGYFIARETLPARHRDGLWAWPLQLAEKSWCTPRLFREAFLAALDRFGLDRDEALARSFAVGFGLRPALGGRDGFVALGELVRPKPVARKRPGETKAASRAPARSRTDGRMPAGASA